MLSHCETFETSVEMRNLLHKNMSIMTPMMFASYYDFPDLGW